MKNYQVFYWVSNLEKVTGYAHKEEITQEQVIELITKQEVNIMVQNNIKSNICFIDELGMRFQQR